MIKLVPAKCPSCGAKLELDDNLKRTECKYCSTTIIVDEAIEKYQVEVKGNVKVSGIKDEDEKLNIIKKYIKIEYFNEAMDKLYDFLEEYPFNMEAIKMLIKIYVGYYPIDIEKNIIFKNRVEVEKITNALVDKLVKLDDDNVYSDFINEVREKQRKNREEIAIKNKETARKKELEQELIEKVNKYLEIGLKKKKCTKFVITLFANLKIDISKYGENMCLLDAKEVQWVHDVGYHTIYPNPYVKSIGEDGIIIGGLLLDDNFLDKSNRDSLGRINYKKQYNKYYQDGVLGTDLNQDKLGYDYSRYRTIDLKRNELITFEDQIEIVDRLLEESNSSFINKLFGKNN